MARTWRLLALGLEVITNRELGLPFPAIPIHSWLGRRKSTLAENPSRQERLACALGQLGVCDERDCLTRGLAQAVRTP